MSFGHVLFLLLVAHAVCDYPLQGDFLAKAKNERAPIAGVPWQQAMTAHCLIHAGAVYLITGSSLLAVMEFCVHLITDRAKCCGHIGFTADQTIHYVCKIAWAFMAVVFGGKLP